MSNKNMPKIVLGTWAWGVGTVGGDQIFGHNLGENELKPVFEAALKSGLNLFDTAVAYGMGASEELLGKFVKEVGADKVILSTKYTPNIADKSQENPAITMIEGSLERLGTDSIDIYWIHNPSDLENSAKYIIPLAKSGKVKRIGVSNHNMNEIKTVAEIFGKEGIKISAIQNHYSLLYRSSEEAGLLDYCKENDIQFFAYMVLEQGALGGKYNTKNPLPENSARGEKYNPLLLQIEKITEVLSEIGKKHNATMAQTAIAWAINKGTTPIIGVSSVAQVEEAAKTTQIVLSKDEMEQIEKVAKEANIDTKAFWENSMTE